MSTSLLLQQFLNGLAIGGVYAIFALGYTLVFSILRVINFAHGAVFTLGAYFTYMFTGAAFGFNGLLANLALPVHFPFGVAALCGALLAGVAGVLVERVAFRPLRARNADPLLTLVSSLGVAITIVNLIQYLVGAEIYTYQAQALGNVPAAINFGTAQHPILVRMVQVVIFAAALVMVTLLTYVINRTKVGKALRAVAEDATTARLLGIHTDRLIVLTFFISGFLGGTAGTFVGLNVSIAGPYFGIAYGLKGLAVIVLGGLGSIPGAVVGGLVIGLAEAFVPAQSVAYKDAVAFALLFLMLLARPDGLLGQTTIQKV